MPAKKGLYLETTAVSVEKTAAEITTQLRLAGARRIVMDYGEDGTITAMNFVLVINDVPHPFAMPVRTAGVFKIINGRRDGSYLQQKYRIIDGMQAQRTAWRQLLAWIKIQLAMVQCGMVEAREVFLPYLVDQGGKTVFQYFEETRFKALPMPEEKGA